ncbi:cellulose synthase/poly-beta-1,6-N-acetylglucosamine synthase-like glycosyltransferase [Salsuginibacillus halophilus]|uniref:Cellulose synthase/poly-beta-1,6-N-acetylglucosamine synthase-like glycosyltransferase n=1 Tax=Salsuginibacillus halophilus TaxID=517424 RepID=A0A2P8HAL7_9BACI|nr:glycosyltransferase family 2 protein [Salsuginibacillus halophilus]PSL43268.1 cellulose synthase/poly-beta-1,6-N-acetylglucosamine synthase-like glycosyltransferase [Salsuginibacillus halophilus]
MTVWIIFLSCILLWVIINRCFLIPFKPGPVQDESEAPFISILVPLRNERDNVDGLIQALQASTYEHTEWIFLDDGSTDKTLETLQASTAHVHNVKIIQGRPLPDGWVGKVHACHQLSEHARGDYLCFFDADVRPAPKAVEAALFTSRRYEAGLVSGFPHFTYQGWLSSLLVPMQHVLILLHLPLAIANFTKLPAASAAHGAFMFFERKAYDKAGGHAAIKDSLVEDVHFMRLMKKSGARGILTRVSRFVTCRMYTDSRSTWEGFSKNAFPGIGRSYTALGFISVVYFGLFILPAFFAVYGMLNGTLLYTAPLFLTWLIRAVIDWTNYERWWLFVTHPFAAAAFLAVLWRSAWLHLKKRGFQWKGRRYA